MINQTIKTSSAEETQHFAQQLAKQLQGGEVILLYGDLGVGKTTFMQGLAEGLGITQRIMSPTFIIMRKYELRFINKDLGIKTLYHLDLYRISSENDLDGLGLKETLEDKGAIVAIEWPEKLGNLMPEKRIEIKFKTISENEREIQFSQIS